MRTFRVRIRANAGSPNPRLAGWWKDQEKACHSCPTRHWVGWSSMHGCRQMSWFTRSNKMVSIPEVYSMRQHECYWDLATALTRTVKWKSEIHVGLQDRSKWKLKRRSPTASLSFVTMSFFIVATLKMMYTYPGVVQDPLSSSRDLINYSWA